MAQPAVQNYSPFTWETPESDVPIVQPLYYGLNLFARATRNTARIVRTSRDDEHLAPFLKVYATTSEDELSVTLLHKNDTMDDVLVSVNFTAPSIHHDDFKFPVGQLRTMEAPSLRELFNVSFGGLTWVNTTNGDPTSKENVIPIQPEIDASGLFAVYTVHMLPASGALLQIRLNEHDERKQHRHIRHIRHQKL